MSGKKIISMILVSVLPVTLTAGCGPQEESADGMSNVEEGTETGEWIFEPGVIYDENGVTVTLIQYSDISIYPGFDVVIENTTDQEILVSTDLISANGTMISAGLGKAVDVPADDVLEDTIYLDTGMTDIAGISIEEISDIQMEIEFYQPNSTADLFDPVRVDIPVREAAGDTGREEPVLYETEDVRITKMDHAELYGEESENLYVRIANKTGEDLTCQLSDVKVNDSSIDSMPAYSMGFGWAREENFAVIFPENDMVAKLPVEAAELSPEGTDETSSVSFIFRILSGGGSEEIIDLTLAP